MLQNDKSARDAFTLSLGGMRMVSSFAFAPAIAHDRLRQRRGGQVRDSRRQKWRFWIPRRYRVA